MNLFSISQLQQFSGIKAHTIRVWEQRYNGLKPTRSEGNTRYYDNTQLRRLLNIVSLMNSGYKISELCTMSDSKLFKILEQKLETASESNQLSQYYISQLIAAGIEYDEGQFKKIFSNSLLRLGVHRTYLEVVYPMLVKLGLMWANNRLAPSYEYFISNLIKQNFYTLTDTIPLASSTSNSWLLFLPEDEFHEIGLLFAKYQIRQSGNKVIYIGANIPFDSLKETVKETKPSQLLLFFVHYNVPENTQKYLDRLSRTFLKQKIFISGNEKLISQIKPGKNIKWLKTVQDLEKIIKN
jgi:DNA-binding transcriptional MerR regulator